MTPNVYSPTRVAGVEGVVYSPIDSTESSKVIMSMTFQSLS